MRRRTGEDARVDDRKDDSNNKGKSTIRITNSDRLWNSMIRNPEKTRLILETKIRPYINILKKNSPGLYVKYDKLIMDITMKIGNLEASDLKNKSSLNEDFILGYYYQKNEFYNKRDKTDKAN